MIVIETIADLGEIRNLKTDETMAFYNAVKRISDDVKVICRDYRPKINKKNNPDFIKAVPGGNFIFKMVTFFEMNISPFEGRRLTNKIFDFFASRKISGNDTLVAIPGSYPKSIRKAKKSIIYCVTAHPIEFARQTGYKIDQHDIKAWSYADHYIAISHYVKETMLMHGIDKDRITVVPISVDTKRFVPKKRKDSTFRIIAVGNYQKFKRFDLLAKAWADLGLKNSELIIVGEPVGEMRFIMKQFRHIPGFRQIGFTDPLPYYQESSVLVHPSMTEAWGKVVTEGMACGLPVIVSENTGAKEAVKDGENGFIIPAGDIEALKRKILYFYKNRKEIERFGKNARAAVEKEYTIDKFSNRLYKEFKRLIEE